MKRTTDVGFPPPHAIPSGRWQGMAFAMVIGILGLLTIIGLSISQTSIVNRWSITAAGNDRKAEEITEAATNFVFRLVQQEMNDMALFQTALQDPSRFLEKGRWFAQCRLPAFMGGPGGDPLQALNLKNAAIAAGIDQALDLSHGLLQPVYDQGIAYTYEYVRGNPVGTGDQRFIVLDQVLEALGGRTKITARAKIINACGILPRSPDYEIGGVTAQTNAPRGPLARLIDTVTPEPFTFSYNLLNLIPDDNLIAQGITQSLQDIVVFCPTGYGPPIPVGQLLATFGLDDFIADAVVSALGLEDLNLRSLAQMVIGSHANVSLDLSFLQTLVQNTILNFLPPLFRLAVGVPSWGCTIEKIATLQVTTTVEYQPHHPQSGPTISKTLVAERELRVADIQPVAPDHTFFVANSDKVYETDAERGGWSGNQPIDWNAGNGEFFLHNLPGITSVIDSLGGLSTDLFELSRNVQLPGLVRVNGTHQGAIRLSWAIPIPPQKIRKNEIMAVAMEGLSVIPRVERQFWNIFGGDGWHWPWFQSDGWWLPSTPMYNRTFLFGDMDLELPFNLRVEGNLRKDFNRIRIVFVNFYLPPILAWPGIGIVVPIVWAHDANAPYGVAGIPAVADGESRESAWDPNDPRNLPPNLYSTAQYLKKSAHYYETAQEFWDDVPKRMREVGGETVFDANGVTFVNDHLVIPSSGLKVVGRGMLVAAGNIHLLGDVRRVGTDPAAHAPTVFSLIARNGGLINNSPTMGARVEACVYADRGVYNDAMRKLEIDGNLVVNRFNRAAMQGEVHVTYRSRHARSSMLSLVRSIAKWDLSRYVVSMAARFKSFEFVKR